MPQISNGTMIPVIQSLHLRMEQLIAARNGSAPQERADLDEILLSYEKAAQELKTAYGIARSHDPSLPQYGWLVQPTRS